MQVPSIPYNYSYINPYFGESANTVTKAGSGETSDMYYTQMKQTCGDDFFDSYVQEIALSSLNPHIADIGACTGDLMRNIRANYPNIYTTNLDLTDAFAAAAQKEDEEAGLSSNTDYICANALSLPFEASSMNALFYSRVFHEIYSYESPEFNTGKFSEESIAKALKEAHRVLKPGGMVLIQDPAKPQNCFELVTISNFSDKSTNISDEELLKADVTKLKGEDLLRRFLLEFEPAKNNYKKLPKGYQMPKWLASEFIRHRRFNETKEHWADEINEQYSPITPKEYVDLAKSIGFEYAGSDVLFLPDEKNIYAYTNAFEVTDSQGNKMLQSKDFPLGMLLALKKKQCITPTTFCGYLLPNNFNKVM